ncbi:uncharacterized protein B0T23DRAFT_299868, partial [Neurospora hispaniola]
MTRCQTSWASNMTVTINDLLTDKMAGWCSIRVLDCQAEHRFLNPAMHLAIDDHPVPVTGNSRDAASPVQAAEFQATLGERGG